MTNAYHITRDPTPEERGETVVVPEQSATRPDDITDYPESSGSPRENSSDGTETTALLEEIAFLARSEHRIDVLDALSEAPHTKRELAERTSVSRVTLWRTLRELVERRWIVQCDSEYRTTPLGELVAGEFAGLLTTMATERRLRDVMQWFPTDEVPFDVGNLCDAEIVLATQSDPLAPVRREFEWSSGSGRLRALSYQTVPTSVDAVVQAAANDEQPFEVVLTPDILDTVMSTLRKASEYDGGRGPIQTSFFVYDGDLPVVYVTDTATGIRLTDGDDVPRALVLSDDPTVYAWAVDTFEAYRERAVPVDPVPVSAQISDLGSRPLTPPRF